MTDDVRIGTVAVLAATGDTLEPYAVFWQSAYEKPNGRRYASRPKGGSWYRRKRGGAAFKVLKHTFIRREIT